MKVVAFVKEKEKRKRTNQTYTNTSLQIQSFNTSISYLFKQEIELVLDFGCYGIIKYFERVIRVF